MKKLAILALLTLAIGCKTVSTTQPLAPGAVTATDQAINANLQAAHAAVLQYEADVNSGKHLPSAAEKTIVNDLIVSLNTADPIYQSYHAQLVANPSTTEPQQLIDALAAVTSNLASIQSLIQAVK